MEELKIVFEDNHCLVVIKPQNVGSQADESKDLDLLTMVKDYIKVKENKPGNVYAGLVHRLDRPTGGVMVFAKTSKAASRLSEQIKNGLFHKTYLACVCGNPKERQGKLINYLLKDERNNKVEVVPQATVGAKDAILEYKTTDTVGNLTLVQISLITGRGHQARVQMSHIGCPIWGDAKYGGVGKGNLALWAHILEFDHPTSGQRLKFIVNPPTDQEPWKRFESLKKKV